MNDLNKLYDIAEKEKIDVYEKSWSNTYARIFEIDDNYIIAFDKNKIENSFQEKEIFAEELRTLLL